MEKEKRPMLCRFGFHKWKFIYRENGEMFRCKRCYAKGKAKEEEDAI